MAQLFYVIAGTANLLVQVLLWGILIRVVMSMYVDEEEPSRVYIFCCAVTEPIVAPTRSLLGRIKALEDSPIDLSYFVTALILIIVEAALRIF